MQGFQTFLFQCPFRMGNVFLSFVLWQKKFRASSGQIYKAEETEEFKNPASSPWNVRLGGEGGEEVFSANFHLDIYYNSNYSEGIIFYGDQEHNS